MVGFAAIKLLEDTGCVVESPRAQMCCGRPACNSGDRRTAQAIGQQAIAAFTGYHYVVVPSGYCGGMLPHHLPHLFDDDPALKVRAEEVSDRTYECVSFPADVLHAPPPTVAYDGIATYHDSCDGLREIGIKAQPRAMLAGMTGDVPPIGRASDSGCTH